MKVLWVAFSERCEANAVEGFNFLFLELNFG